MTRAQHFYTIWKIDVQIDGPNLVALRDAIFRHRLKKKNREQMAKISIPSPGSARVRHDIFMFSDKQACVRERSDSNTIGMSSSNLNAVSDQEIYDQ